MQQDALELAMKVVDNVDVLLGYWDRDLRCGFANAAYKTWFGKTRAEMLGIHMREALGPLFELNRPHIEAALRGEVRVFERDIRIADGSVRHSLVSYYPDIHDGVVRGFTIHTADVTRMKILELELAQAKERAETLATHDFLTGLPNRVLLMDRIEKAMERAERSGGLVGIVALDLDDFKLVNDTYGHALGDTFLKGIAKRMQKTIRAADTVTRIGGDEFIYLLTDLDTIAHIEWAAKRLHKAMAQPLKCLDISVRSSCSCGIAVYPWHGSDANGLLEMADKALYEAKRNGKRCIAFAELPKDALGGPPSGISG